MLTNPAWWIVVAALLALLIIMRLILRVSSQWRVLKKNWTWKDECLDSAFYFVVLISVAAVVFKLFEYIHPF